MMTEKAFRAGPAPLFFSLGSAVLVGFIIYIGRGVLIPFVIAAFLCFLIYTLQQAVLKTPVIGKYLPTTLSYLIAFTVIVFAFFLFISIVRTNIVEVLRVWPNYEDRLIGFGRTLIDWVQSFDFIPEEMLGGVEEIQNAALGLVTPVLRRSLNSLGSITSNFLTLGTVLFYMAFMLLERGRIFKKIGLLSSDDRQRQAVFETIGDIGGLIRQYITVKTTTNLVTATISYGIMRAFGLDFAGFWALLIFVFNFIPIFGAILAITLPVLLMVVQPDGGPARAAFLLAVMVGAEQLMSSVIEPRLIGRTLNLSPLIILFSLAVWGSLWGFTGILLSIPMTISVMLVLSQFETTRPIAVMLSDNGQIAAIKHGRLGAGGRPASPPA